EKCSGDPMRAHYLIDTLKAWPDSRGTVTLLDWIENQLRTGECEKIAARDALGDVPLNAEAIRRLAALIQEPGIDGARRLDLMVTLLVNPTREAKPVAHELLGHCIPSIDMENLVSMLGWGSDPPTLLREIATDPQLPATLRVFAVAQLAEQVGSQVA